MSNNSKWPVFFALILIFPLFISAQTTPDQKPKITFIELGSVRCIPCRKMMPVMKDIEKEYAGTVKVIFYDVWTRKGRPFGARYKIRLIPTQIFLDADGKEFFRHEGFLPKKEIISLLESRGIR